MRLRINKEEVIKVIFPSFYHKLKTWINTKLAKTDEVIGSKWEEFAGGALDSTADSRDIKWEEIASNEDEFELPRRFVLDNGVTTDQWRTNHCVGFGSTEGKNEWANYYKMDVPYLDPDKTVNYIKENLDDQISIRGTWIYNWPKALKQMGEIYAYYSVKTLEQFKKAIYLGCTIQTGTNKLSWSMTSRNWVAVMKSWGGHHMNVVWFDDDLTRADGYWKTYTGFLIIENTWWEKWWDRGRYYLPYELMDKVLFNTRLAMIVNKEATEERAINLIKNIDEKLEEIKEPSLQIAIKEWFISDRDLDKPITRREVGIIAGRLFRKLNK